MAETMKPRGELAPPSGSGKMSSLGDCVDAILRLLAGFGTELKLGDGALRIEVNPSAVNLQSCAAAHAYSCLMGHIEKLQTVSESLRTLASAESDATPALDDASGDVVTSSTARERASAPPERRTTPDDVTVQIRAGKSEIERRISAFMERKQMEINENNVREFCNVIDCNQEDSCARTDAVFTPYPGFKSHVKVTRVVNTYGPQTRGAGGQGEAGEPQRGAVARVGGNAAVEERLHNIEAHLKLPAAGPVPLTVYQRLKKLEDRILELEGLSPEYFQSTRLILLGDVRGTQKAADKWHRELLQTEPSHLHKRPKTSAAQACSLTELDEKISAVKAALLKRVTDLEPPYGTECPL